VQNYPVRTDHRPRLERTALLDSCRSAFGQAEVVGDEVIASFGALKRLAVRADGRALRVDVTMDPKVPEDVAKETVRRYNLFLEDTTGYSSKERARRLRKAASKE
jgi:hypothetical protein